MHFWKYVRQAIESIENGVLKTRDLDNLEMSLQKQRLSFGNLFSAIANVIFDGIQPRCTYIVDVQ